MTTTSWTRSRPNRRKLFPAPWLRAKEWCCGPEAARRTRCDPAPELVFRPSLWLAALNGYPAELASLGSSARCLARAHPAGDPRGPGAGGNPDRLGAARDRGGLRAGLRSRAAGDHAGGAALRAAAVGARHLCRRDRDSPGVRLWPRARHAAAVVRRVHRSGPADGADLGIPRAIRPAPRFLSQGADPALGLHIHRAARSAL